MDKLILILIEKELTDFFDGYTVECIEIDYNEDIIKFRIVEQSEDFTINFGEFSDMVIQNLYK